MTCANPLRRRVTLYALALLTCTAVSTAVPAGAATPSPESRVDTASAAGAVPMAVTFGENFDGPAGSAVNGGRWQIETGDNVNNHERQYYTAGNNNAALDGQGNLVITARKDNPGNYQCWYGRCEYTSARLNTAGKFAAQYGRVEARMKIPRAGHVARVAGANPANGTPVQLYDCDGSGAQQWSRGANDSLRALGKCLDVKDNSTADGAQIQLWDCAGTGNQRWAVSGANDVVNIQADKCMDVTGGASVNGARARIWTCTGAANQKWSVNA